MYIVATVSLTQVEASVVCGCCCIIGHCLAVPFPTTSQVSTRLPAATWHRRSIALKPVMHCSLVIGRAFNWHISLLYNCAFLLYFIVHAIAQPFFKLQMPLFLVAKCPTITILLKSHFIFCANHEYNFRSHRSSSRCMISNVFCFLRYPKLFFCRERAIPRSCSNSLLNTWFALHSLTRDGIICLRRSSINLVSNNACTPVFLC